MPTADEIKTAILEILDTGPKLGSQLAAAVQRKFHPHRIDFKASFGGLASFIHIHCEREVLIVERYGLDFRYGRNGPTAVRNTAFSGSDAISSRPESAWKVFVHPLSKKNLLAVSPETGELILKETGAELLPGLISIRKLAPDDHREMIRTFVTEHSPEKAFSVDFLSGSSFWSEWQKMLASLPQVQKTWSQFRTNAIIEAFRQRMIEAGVSPNVATFAEQNLMKSRVPLLRASVRYQQDVKKQDLRNVVLGVVRDLSDDQLRQICLPVGKVWDSIYPRS